MYKLTFIFCFLILQLLFPNLYSQSFNTAHQNSAPWLSQVINPVKQTMAPNPNTTGYAYYSYNVFYSQLFKFSVSSPNVTTTIGSPKAHHMMSGDFANPTGVWKYYVQQDTFPYTIFEVDTATGNLTSVGAPSGLKSGHTPNDMEWDPVSNTMYMVSVNSTLTETQFYSIYWPTKALSWIGSSASAPGGITAGGFNANGTYFGIDIMTDALWKINKFTGAWTMVGPLGYPVSFYQDAGFDRSDYSKMLWCACGGTVGLYQVDTSTGAATLISPFPGYSGVYGVAFVPYPGPQISHNPLQNTANVNGPYAVNAAVIPYSSGIAATKLYWSRNNTAVTDSIAMTNTGGNNWTGNIPGNGLTATYRYYIRANDSLNNFVSAPFSAPASLYTFYANANDTVKPVITHSPHGNIYKYQWPDSIFATVTDSYGIDSVWVKWRVNSNPSKYLKLLNQSGNLYTALFNSLNSDVSIGDTIYYRITAQDNSPNHNRDSSDLFSFNIISSFYSCIGNGTVQIPYGSPFYTFWNGYKTQMLWTASEIYANGGVTGNLTQIGFYILRFDTLRMNNFNIKIQNTPITILTNGFITSDWTTVYSGTYGVSSTGWQYIDLQTPFYWDGVNNLLIEICFGNKTSAQYGTYVQGTLVSGMEYYTYFTDTVGLACTTYKSASGSSARPNACFHFIPTIEVSNNSNGIPASYNLYQNYPNPFNPVTKIKYDITKQGFVSLKIYDILGREVKTPVNEIKSVGSYIIDFDASGLPSGIYFYRLECNGFVETKRMLMIK
jgi:hypothetical protein